VEDGGRKRGIKKPDPFEQHLASEEGDEKVYI
jgi:hypothetical protein